ncbi:MAG: riboflavin synthase [Thermoanaerobaculum sp.]
MFSGIVQAVGTLVRRESAGRGQRLVVRGVLPGLPLEPGESVAVSGACLTVEEVLGDALRFYCSEETLARTTLGTVPVGGALNLERALRVGDPLGGHWVSGHVDAKAQVLALHKQGEGAVLRCQIPRGLAPELAEKGSVALDGVSLTVARVGGGWFEVSLVPFTLERTTLGRLRRGAWVNLETDLLAKYVRRLLSVPR